MTPEVRDLLSVCRSVIRDYHMGCPEKELVQSPRGVIDRITAALGDAYDINTGEQEDRTRPVEVMRCWSDYTWDTTTVDIPNLTPEDKLNEVSSQVAYHDLSSESQADIVQIDLYHVPEPGEEEETLAGISQS